MLLRPRLLDAREVEPRWYPEKAPEFVPRRDEADDRCEPLSVVPRE
jgi:hypothetical protein